MLIVSNYILSKIILKEIVICSGKSIIIGEGVEKSENMNYLLVKNEIKKKKYH